MNKSRIELLNKFIEDDPNDPFNYYALALEFQNSDIEKANGLFQKLLEEFPNYLPTYYTAGNFYADHGRDQDALLTFEKGIELAKSYSDSKALKELQAALLNLDS